MIPQRPQPRERTSGLADLRPVHEYLRRGPIADEPTQLMTAVSSRFPEASWIVDQYQKSKQLEISDPNRKTIDMVRELIHRYMLMYGRYPDYLLLGKLARRHDLRLNQYVIPGTGHVINASYVAGMYDVLVR